MDFEFWHEKRGFRISARNCGFFRKISGLMFTRKKKAEALLFDLKKPSKLSLHSIFVSFDFLVLWLDGKNRVVDFKICKPWKFSISTKKNFMKILEIPINGKYKLIANNFLGKL